ncbi:MAG: pyruvate/phosphoenolpyruvate kinase domain-containing protein, partial [Elusimicrobia bacterium]
MAAKTTLSPEALAPILAALDDAEEAFRAGTPGSAGGRRPVHVLYGGADRFRAETAAKMGSLALKAFDERLPDAAALARVTGMPAALAAAVRPR